MLAASSSACMAWFVDVSRLPDSLTRGTAQTSQGYFIYYLYHAQGKHRQSGSGSQQAQLHAETL